MGSSKLNGAQPYQAQYHDEPQENDRAETASMASAVLLDNMESYPEDEPPAYSDVPDHPSNDAIAPPRSNRNIGSLY